MRKFNAFLRATPVFVVGGLGLVILVVWSVILLGVLLFTRLLGEDNIDTYR